MGTEASTGNRSPVTQTLAATLNAPERPGLSLGYRVLTLAGANYSALTTSGITEDSPPGGSYRITGGIVAPDPGGFLQWWRVSGGVGVELLALVAIAPASALATDYRLDFLDRPLGTLRPREGWPNGPLAGY